MKAALMLLATFQASATDPPPSAEPFDCSWVYEAPRGSFERFEGVYTSFIDDGGVYACSSAKACAAWIGQEKAEVDFSERAAAQFRKRSRANYGVFRIVFEGRRGRLKDRPGCEPHRFSVNPTPEYYLRIEKVLSVKELEKTER